MIKPVKGIENSKFRPIIRELPSVRVDLPRCKAKPAQVVAKKMLKEVKPPEPATNANQGGSSSFAMTPSESAQQSGSRPKSKEARKVAKTGNITINKTKVKKIMKFDKVIQKFCEQIGIEKKTLLSALNGGEEKDLKENISVPNLSARPATTIPEFHNKSIDTGKAALLAYTNLDPSPAVEESLNNDFRKSGNTRNVPMAHSNKGVEP